MATVAESPAGILIRLTADSCSFDPLEGYERFETLRGSLPIESTTPKLRKSIADAEARWGDIAGQLSLIQLELLYAADEADKHAEACTVKSD